MESNPKDYPGKAVKSQAVTEKIEKTISYMKLHLAEVIGREALASIAELNQEHYSRIFKKYKGASPLEYLNNLRMEEAKRLLLESDMGISEIARAVGFADPFHFSRRFKQRVGVAPVYYANRPPHRIAALDGYGHCTALGLVPVAADWNVIGACLSPDPTLTGQLNADAEGRVAADAWKRWMPDVVLTAREDGGQGIPDSCQVVTIDMHADPVYDQLPRLAERFGKEEEAQAWIARYEQRKAQLGSEVKERIGRRKVAVIRIREHLLQVYGMLNMGYPLYESLGLSPPDKITMLSLFNAHFHSIVIEPEELPLYAADALFVVIQPDKGAMSYWEKLSTMEIWRQYPAVSSGSVYRLDVKRWLAFDPISILAQMEEAAVLLTGDKQVTNIHP
ncbi:helix-turn-helix domain-containing protein [Paenibacillus sp. HB172176]|uniref:helix-turn-helix domain-containing protein n=1 Tax=Paenibacillus sp. HB172176 TaxID=2493690 RepID=UPI00143A9057|nr:helix-turn-helix domain-containing protein [Paenibacillus sp. HB172176]